MSSFWILCVCQVYSPAQDHCSKQTPGALDLSRLCLGCSSVHKSLSNFEMHLLLLWHSNRLTQQGCPFWGTAPRFRAGGHRSPQLHRHHSPR